MGYGDRAGSSVAVAASGSAVVTTPAPREMCPSRPADSAVAKSPLPWWTPLHASDTALVST